MTAKPNPAGFCLPPTGPDPAVTANYSRAVTVSACHG